MRGRKPVLQIFHEGFVEAGKEREHAVDGRGIRDGIGGVNDGLSSEILNAAEFKGIRCHAAFYGQNYQIAERRCIRKACNDDSGILRCPVGEPVRRTSSDSYLMAMLQKAGC